MDARVLVYVVSVITLLPLLVFACPNGQQYCPARNGCVSISQNCSDGEIQTCVNLTSACKKNGTVFCVDISNYTCERNNVSCGNGSKYCPSKKECIDSDKPCCSIDDEACMEVLEYMYFFSKSETLKTVCDLLVTDDGNFSANYSKFKYNNPLEKKMCSNGTYFCPLLLDCIPMNQTCDPDQVFEMEDSFEVFDKACAAATGNKTFCPLYMHCIPQHEDCSYRKLFDWYKAGNKSVDPFSRPCPANTTFCPLIFSCNHTCDPVDRMGNKSCNGTNGGMCDKPMRCGENGTDCPNFTNVTDPTGSGWLETCKYRRLIKSVFWMKSKECKPRAEKCKKEKECDFEVCEKLRYMNKTKWLWSEIKSKGMANLWISRCNFTVDAELLDMCNMTREKTCDVYKLCDELEDELEEYKNASWLNKTMTVTVEHCNITVNETVSRICKERSCEVHRLCHMLGDALERYKNDSSFNETISVANCSITMAPEVWAKCGNYSCEIEDICEKLRKKMKYEKNVNWKMLNNTVEIDRCGITLNESLAELCNVTDDCKVKKLCKRIRENDYNKSMVNKTVRIEGCDIVLDNKTLSECEIDFKPPCKVEDLCPKYRELAENHTIYSFPKYVGPCKTIFKDFGPFQCNITLRKLTDYYYEMFYNGFKISDSVKKAISLIAVRGPGVAAGDGVWEYSKNGAWTPVGSVSSGWALVLDTAIRLRFLANDSSWHGLATLMYTPVKKGSTGSHVNVSDILHDPRHTLALLRYPSPPVPNVTRFIRGKYTVGEDEKTAGFMIEDRIEMNLSHTAQEKWMDGNMSDYLEHVHPKVLKDYNETVRCFKEFEPGIAIIEVGDASTQGLWEVNKRPVKTATITRPQVVAPHDRLRFVSAKHIHGNWSMKFLPVAFSNCSASVKKGYLGAPAPLAHALKAVMMQRNTSRDVREMVEDALEDMAAKGTSFSLANFNGAVDRLSGSTEDKNAAKDIASLAFDHAVNLPKPGRLDGLPTALHPKGNLVILNNPTVFTFDVHVTPINDQPIVKIPRVLFPPIAYNLTTHSNLGKDVKYLLTMARASDFDQDTVGIAIVEALNSSLGSWYYKSPFGAWAQLIVDNSGYTDGRSGLLSSFILNSSYFLKFQPRSDDILWTNLEASRYAKIVFLPWDGTDGLTIGWRNITRPSEDVSAYGDKSVTAIVQRLGCDGRPGSKGVKDQCGICGGDGKGCRGCDGGLFSKAVFDKCGNCTGGNTGVKFNVMVDCAGTCGLSFKDECNICQERGKVRNYTDCAGKCHGGAKENRCGYCTGGSSGKPVTYGQDVCGVCSGDNSTCLDCARVPKGGKVWDNCGKCLLPSDASFNNQCVKLKRTIPNSGPSVGGVELMVQGAGFKAYSTVSCSMIHNTTNLKTSVQSSSFEMSEEGSVIKFTSPPLKPGYYSVLCQLGSDASHRVEDNMFLVYNKSAITYTSISPEYTDINTAETAVITGSGFVNTTDIACISRDRRVYDAEFVNSTSVSCSIPATKGSVRLQLGVSFSRGDRLLGVDFVNFTIYANASSPVAARFLNNLRGVEVEFDVPTKAVDRSRDCAIFFPESNVSSFGTKSKCFFRTPLKMVIILRGKPTLVPQQNISFKLRSITQRRQMVTKEPAETYKDLKVDLPKVPVVPKAVIAGTAVLGLCAKLRLRGGQSRGAGGRRLKFRWAVKWADSVNLGNLDSNATDDLNTTQTYLESLPDFTPQIRQKGHMIVIGPRYNFTLRVRNFLGEWSEEVSLVVERQDKTLPGLSLGAERKRMKTALGMTLKAKIILSSCLPPGYQPKVLYNWEISAVGVDLGPANTARLTIPPRRLPSKEYTVTITARMESDLTLATTATITLVVEESPLVAIIKGGGSMVVGEDDTFTLDGSRSSDPDGTSDTAGYAWQCSDKEGFPCFEPDTSNPGRERRMVIESKAKVSIKVAGKLKTNTNYRFVLLFRKGGRKKEASVSVIVKSGSPPSAIIRSLSAVKVNPSDVLILESLIISKKTVNATWSCVQSDEYSYIDLEESGVALTRRFRQFKKRSGKAVVAASPSLVIAKNKLQDGVVYKFQLTAEHSDASSFADIEIVTNSAPSLGSLEVDPPSGFFGNTTFTLSAAEGWDDDPDDLPMMYTFGYYTPDDELQKKILGGPSEVNSLEVNILPPGDPTKNNTLQVFVEVSDIYGAVTIQTVTVTVHPVPLDVSSLTQLEGTVGKDFDSGDMTKATANANAIAAALANSNDPATKEAGRKFKKAVTGKILSAVEEGGIRDKAGRAIVIGSLSPMTDDCQPSCDTMRITKSLVAMLVRAVSSSKRRRRAVVVSSDDIEIKTGDEVANILKVFQNVINPKNYSNDSLVAKADFLATVKSQEPSLCKGLATGGPFALAKSNITVMRAVKDSFASVDTQFNEISTSTSPEYIEASVLYRLGERLKELYESWACTADDTCTGTCIATAQFKDDLLVQHDPAEKNMTRLSDVASLRLYNPQTLAEISVSGLASPVALRFPIDHGEMYENYTKECRVWHDGSKEWRTSGCSWYQATNTSIVECRCTQLGYIAAFLGPEGLPTPTPTEASSITTQTPVQQEAQVVEFAFDANYSEVISGNLTKAVFVSNLRIFLAKRLNISQARITNIDIRSGSIIVTLTIQASNNTNEASVNSTVLELEQLVKTNSLNFTLPGTNITIRVDPSSFRVIPKPTAAPPADDDDDDDLSTAEIVIIVVVCVVVGIIIIAALVYYFVRVRPARAGKISPHSSQIELNEQQNNNQAEKDAGVANSAVDEETEKGEKAV